MPGNETVPWWLKTTGGAQPQPIAPAGEETSTLPVRRRAPPRQTRFEAPLTEDSKEIDLHNVGDNAINGDDNVDKALSDQPSIDQGIELIQPVELGGGCWTEDRRHWYAIDRDLHAAAVSDAGQEQREEDLVVCRT
jgi:hypothetical protein